jgi:hypothetical protein
MIPAARSVSFDAGSAANACACTKTKGLFKANNACCGTVV